jgi:hypothetical protein
MLYLVFGLLIINGISLLLVSRQLGQLDGELKLLRDEMTVLEHELFELNERWWK